MIDWLSGWYNWLFLFPLFLGIIFIAVDTLLGGLSELIGMADFDLDFDGDGDVDLDVDVEAGHGAWLSGLLWLGMGKVPISVLLEVLTISFGVTGLFINALWSEISPEATYGLSFPVAVIGAVVASVFLTKFTAKWFARLVPSDSTISIKPGGWKGRTGTVVNTVTTLAGQVKVEGQGKAPAAFINAKTDPSTPDDIPRGTEVVVMEYVQTTNSYYVTPMEISS
jgi:membrane protein implicated in regulation of membrane protease activity